MYIIIIIIIVFPSQLSSDRCKACDILNSNQPSLSALTVLLWTKRPICLLGVQ